MKANTVEIRRGSHQLTRLPRALKVWLWVSTITDESWIGRNLNGNGPDLVELLSRHFPMTVENHEKRHSG
jgi:hypothetical protein